MKSKIISLILMMFSLGIWSQSDNQNWIKTTSYKMPFSDEENLPTNPTLDQAVVQVGYFDGLGRPIQSIAQGQGVDNNNIVTHTAYDEYGRQTKEFLPYVSGDQSLDYILGAGTAVSNFYNTEYYQNTTNPFSEKQLENSPLNRVLKQAAPGEDWEMGKGHEIKFGYEANGEAEVLKYGVEITWNINTKVFDIELINDTNYYDANQLYKNITWDENTAKGANERTVEYKDKEGRVVLKRVFANVNNQVIEHDTYYVYDKFGNLTYVIPPVVETGANISNETLNALCYQYKYDERNRLVAKKIPGKQWEYIVYDNLDRIRATGPVLSPFTNFTGANAKGWLITKYDAFNRPIMTGWMQQSTISETERLSLQNSINAITLSDTKSSSDILVNNVKYRYNNASYPTTNYHILTINYYDNYLYWNAPTDFSNVLGQIVKSNLKGMPSGSWVRVLEASTNVNGNLSYSLYKDDHMNTPIKSVTKYYSGGYTQTESLVDFAGEVQQTITKHKKATASTEMVINEQFTYSPQGRLLTHTHQINNEPLEYLTVNNYDDLGQLTSKEVGGQADNPLQTVDYKYNIRGWLTQINDPFKVMDGGNDDLFAFGIQYQNPEEGANALFNGNISETYWKSRTDSQKRMYGYEYDGLNRLTLASYQNVDQNINDSFNEQLNYDKNGNIQSLQRNGGEENSLFVTPIDNLSYFYDAQNKNLLLKVVDLTNSSQGFKDDGTGTVASDTNDDYRYDLNGNMTYDENKNITSIVYNHLNLPVSINFGTGSSIVYMYDATGVKLKKVVNTYSPIQPTISITEYINGFQYNNNEMQFFPTSEGYVNCTTAASIMYYNYVYNYTDHLGNIRMSYTWDEEIQGLSVLEEHHYYPFGLEHSGYISAKKQFEAKLVEVTLPEGGKISIFKPRVIQVVNSGYQYQYNGKEWQDELGLAWYDYGARNYDAALGRWMNIDPLAEEYPSYSPYVYVYNNPLKFIDPTGMEGVDEWEIDKYGKITNVKETDTDSFYMIDDNGDRIDGNCIEFDSEIVQKEITLSGNDGTMVDYLQIKGDENATSLFTFIADNMTETKTEFGLTRVGEKTGETGVNLVGTNQDHIDGTTAANVTVFQNGYSIREANHNHPSGNSASSQGDVDVAGMIQVKFPNATFNNYTTKNGFTPYDKNTEPHIPTTNLQEIIITVKKKKP
jgi:RHS repeat-associated protein